MNRETQILIKKCCQQLSEAIQTETDADITSLLEEVMVFLLAARKISELYDEDTAGSRGDIVLKQNKGYIWPALFDSYQGAVNRLIPWFSARHRNLAVPDGVIRDFWTDDNKKYFADPAAFLGAVHQTALDMPAWPAKEGPDAPARKKRGAYYTPPEIVDYMVEITLERLLTSQAEVRQLRAVDPACGSAAFLTALTDRLIQYYKNLPDGNLHGSPAAGAISHLYGIDSDARAVDLTILGLALRCLSAGGIAGPEEYVKLLRNNIRLGDALTINWQEEFPEVYRGANPGFDLVIGNPPYISNKLLPGPAKEYINRNYHTVEGQYDIIVPFVENGLRQLKEGGRLCFIISNKYLAADYGRKLRAEVLNRHKLLQLTDLSSLKIFADAAVYPVIQLVEKRRGNDTDLVTVNDVRELSQQNDSQDLCEIPVSFFRSLDDMIITTKLNQDIWPVLTAISRIPGRMPAGKILCGIAKTGFSKMVIDSEDYHRLPETERCNYRKYLNSGNIDRFSITGSEGFITLKATTKKQWQSFGGRKLVIPGIAKKIKAAVDEENCALGRVYYIREDDVAYDLCNRFNLYYLCAVYNSKLMDFYYRVLYWPIHLQGGYYRFNSTYLARLPVMAENANMEVAGRITDLAVEAQRSIAKDKIVDEIDRLVFQLYGLTENQVKIINDFLQTAD